MRLIFKAITIAITIAIAINFAVAADPAVYTWYDGDFQHPRKIFLLPTYLGVLKSTVNINTDNIDPNTPEPKPGPAPDGNLPKELKNFGNAKKIKSSASADIYQLSNAYEGYFSAIQAKHAKSSLSSSNNNSNISYNSTYITPVFSEDIDGPPTHLLPGGVIVFLKNLKGDTAVKNWAQENQITLRKKLPHPQEEIWVIESPAGLPTLDLATQLITDKKFQNHIKKSYPDWWTSLGMK
ncbi:MAG: hypothetical protein HQK53_06320 [Oligoflexia bacterium]|nr:hypothetical protein [Oligoflexia bacterium]